MAKKTLGVNPWTQIWIKPRETIQKIVKYNPKYRFIILSFLYGFVMLLHTAQNTSLGDRFTTGGILLGAFILATFVGMLAISIASWLIQWTGKWIGGSADYQSVRAAVAWSNVPNIIGIIVWLAMIYVFGNHIFSTDFEQMNFAGKDLVFAYTALFIQTVASFWSFIILVKALGQVQGFSAWKGVLNVLIPFFLIGIIIWAISWLVWMGSGMIGA